MIAALLMLAQVLVARLPNQLTKASPLLVGPEADVKLLQASTWT